MKIEAPIFDDVSNEILSIVRRSDAPIGIGQTLQLVYNERRDTPRDVVLALLWHLLANHELEFDAMRKLIVPVRAV